MSERNSAVDTLTIYHDLWDLRLRAKRMDREFIVYLLEVALEDLREDLAAVETGTEQNDGTGSFTGT